MLKKVSRDYSQNKSDETDLDDDGNKTATSSIRSSDYLAFDIQEDMKKSIISQDYDTIDNNNHNHLSDEVDFKWLLRSCIEEALSFFLEWAPLTIILIFMTHNYQQNIVSGFGLGLVWLNCMGQGLYYGLGSGLETMASHAHGAKNYEQVGLLFQKTLVVSLFMFLPISILMVYADRILFLWNDKIELCQIAAQFTTYSIPGIAFIAVYYAYKGTLNAQNEYRIQVYSSGLNSLLTILYCLIIISWLDLGVMGAAIIFSLSELTNLLLCYQFAKTKPHLKRCFIPFDKRCFEDLSIFLKTAVPIGSLVALEWILQEINSIIASNLPEEQYSANIAIANLGSTMVQFPLGYATAACTFIGNEMGRGRTANAKKYALYSSYILIIHLIIVCVPAYIFRQSIANTFGVDPAVQQQLGLLILFVIPVHALDATQSLVTAFMRAIAKETYSSVSFLISYALIGLTSSYYLAYHTYLEIQGIWVGIILGMSSYLILQFIMILITDLDKMAKKIQNRMSITDGSQTALLEKTSISSKITNSSL